MAAQRHTALLATALLVLGVVAGVLLSGGEDTTSHPGFGPKGAQVALRVTGEHGVLDLRGMPAAPTRIRVGGNVQAANYFVALTKPRIISLLLVLKVG